MSDDNRVLLEAYRLSERRLEAQFTSALAADQRALSIAGLTIAAAAVLCGLAKDAHVPIAMLGGSVLLVIAAFLAWHSARPQTFFVPGAELDDLSEDIEQGYDFDAVIKQLGGFNDKHTRSNDADMKRSSRNMKWAFGVSIAGMCIAILP